MVRYGKSIGVIMIELMSENRPVFFFFFSHLFSCKDAGRGRSNKHSRKQSSTTITAFRFPI
jgi:hypothetical protein